MDDDVAPAVGGASRWGVSDGGCFVVHDERVDEAADAVGRLEGDSEFDAVRVVGVRLLVRCERAEEEQLDVGPVP